MSLKDKTKIKKKKKKKKKKEFFIHIRNDIT